LDEWGRLRLYRSLRSLGQGGTGIAFWLKGKSRSARPGRVLRSRSRHTTLEALEDRVVLSFAAPVSYNVGTQTTQGLNGFGPQGITGDFDNDGKLDLAVTNSAGGTVNILRGNGNGTFQPAVNYDTGLGAGSPVWLAAADFNGDGKLDLAVEGGYNVSILLGNGNGTFATAKTYAAGSGDRGGLAVGDYFGNGRQDVAVAAFGSNNVETTWRSCPTTATAPSELPSSFRCPPDSVTSAP
jgi:hypothetical protein